MKKILLALIFIVSALHAQTGGTLPVLMEFGVGGRAGGLANAFTAVADDPSAVYWNPAGIPQITSREASLQFFQVGDRMSVFHVAFVNPLTYGNTFGISLYHLGVNDLSEYSANKVLLGSYNMRQDLLSFAYGKSWQRKFFIGLAFKMLYQDIQGETQNKLQIDTGVLLRPADVFSFGLSVQNLLPSFLITQMPMKIRAGIKLSHLKDKFYLSADADKVMLKDFSASQFHWSAGIGLTMLKSLEIMAGMRDMKLSFGLGAEVRSIKLFTSFVQNPMADGGAFLNDGDLQFSVVYKLKDLSQTGQELDYFYKGTVFYNNHDYRNAIKYFRKVLEVRDDPTALYYLENARKYLASEQWMSDEEKKLLDYNIERAQKMAEEQDVGGAIAAYRDVLDINPENQEALTRIEDLKRQVDQEVRILYNEAQSYYKLEKYREVMSKVNSALALNPEHKPSMNLKDKCELKLKDMFAEEQKIEQLQIEAKTLFREGLSEYRGENWAEAISYFQKSLKLVTDDTNVIEYLGKARQNLRASRSMADRRKDADAYFQNGLEAYQNNKLREAITEFEKAVNTFPEFKEAEEYLDQAQAQYNEMINEPLEDGKASLRENRLGDAIQSFRRVLEIDLENAIAQEYLEKTEGMVKDAITSYNRQGDLLYRDSKYAEALQEYRQTLLLDPGNSTAKSSIRRCRDKLKERIDKLFKVAMEQFNNEEYSKAVNTFESILEIDPDYKVAKDRLSEAQKLFEENKTVVLQKENLQEGKDFFFNRNYETAKKYFQKVVDLDPDNEYGKEAVDLLKQSEDKLANQSQEDQIARKFTEGIIAFKNRKYEEAIAIWQEIKEIDPQNEFVDQYIGYAQRAKEERANKSYQDGKTAFSKGDFLAAREAFQKALEVDPDNDKVKDYLARANTKIVTLVKQNKDKAQAAFEGDLYEEALEAYKQVLLFEPENDEMLEKKALTEDIIELYNQGMAAYNNKEYGDAIDFFSQMLSLNKLSAAATEYMKRSTEEGKKQVNQWIREGQEFMEADELRKARNRFNAAMQADPGNREAKALFDEVNSIIEGRLKKAYAAGLDYFNKLNYPRAIQEFNKVLALENPYKDAFSLKEKAVRAVNRSKAEDTAKKQEQAQKFMAEGISLYRNDQLNEAIAEWNKVLKLFPQDEQAKKYIARARYKLQQLER